FFDFNVIKDLAHKLENVLDLIRSGKMVPNPEVVTMLLRGFDRLSGLIDAPEASETADISDELVGLIGLASGFAGKASGRSKTRLFGAPGSSRKLEVDEERIAELLGEGMAIFLLRFDLIHDVHRLGKTPLSIIETLIEGGEILDSAIDILSVGTLDSDSPGDDVPYFMLYASAVSLREIVERLEIPLAGVTLLEMPTAGAVASPPAPRPLASQASTPRAPSAATTATPTPAPATAAVVAATPTEPAKAAVLPPTPAGQPPAQPGQESETVRVSIGVLDDLMNLAGELVLVRNEVADAVGKANQGALQTAVQRMNSVTAGIQDAVMRSRMQPAANLFARYQRTVRDLARELGKDIDLRISGRETELDRSLIESLSDPLTHLVRNSCDHGIEEPARRLAAGKTARGFISLSAAHEAGQVVIEVEDDGKGIDAEAIAAKAAKMGLATPERVALMSRKEKLYLITLPGLSTAEKLSDLSGRGVGMDVVKANVDRLGGRIDIDSLPGKGTKIRISLPLTLSVIPALLAGVGEERFALPQAAAAELLHVRAGDVQRRIERVGDRPVLVLRGEVLPLVRLADAIGMERHYQDGEGKKADRRERVEDRRSATGDASKAGPGAATNERDRSLEDRRFMADSDYRIIVVRASGFRYGVIVDRLFDTTEIVVKPLGRHLKGLKEYAGATILGDGGIALILDPAGLALKAGLTTAGEDRRVTEEEEEALDTTRGWLLFHNGEAEQCAMPLEAVERVVRIARGDIDRIGDELYLRIDGGSLPVFSVASFTGLTRLDEDRAEACVLIRTAGRRFGFLATPPVDSVSADSELDDRSMRRQGVSGTAVIRGRTTVVIDPVGAIATLKPEWLARDGHNPRIEASPGDPPTQTDAGASPKGLTTARTAIDVAPDAPLIVVAEDSDFFRNMVRDILAETGYRVREARDGFEALEIVRDLAGEAAAVVTDVEMPRLDGRDLARKLAVEFPGLPIIALSSLASESDERSLREAGARDYLVKLDRDELLASVATYLNAVGSEGPMAGAHLD
ncbi:MAG TPA: chemotaxis protein CheW, partial [Rectinemataceae bacterium]|nr:chemotaxis protein CheW [Rectinemataceae bacterium]